MTHIKELELMANKLRIHSLESTTAAGSGHPTTCMSMAEIMSCLFFSEMEKDDEFILSKGHAAPILWAAYAEAGIVNPADLKNLRKFDSVLEGHPTPRMYMVKAATGSLGQGLSVGVGMALAKKLQSNDGRTYVVMGDGEIAEGSVWEAANSAAHYNLNNLCAIVDVNRLAQSGPTMHGHDMNIYKSKFEAFGWDAEIINGHKVKEVLNSLKKAKSSSKPYAILAKTFKGRGVSFLEDEEGWHGKALPKDLLKKALEEIGESKINLESKVQEKKLPKVIYNDFEITKYTPGEMIATRTAFGSALVQLGKKNKNIVVLDGDVKNSTMTERFFKEFPDRSFEMFIAEQNMIGATIGFSALGFIPFTATFGAFLTRAYDFIRMAQYSDANIKIVGSHAGVSIGEDGPSQMGLEDLSMFLAMPDSVIFYPSDAVSTEILVREMAKHRGITYMRTTREKTPVLYDEKEKFEISGLKVLKKSKKDKALVIGAGVTVHEALKAYEALQKKKINIRVIDLYCIKPVDETALQMNAKDCKNKVIVVEDHYSNGIGSVVSVVLGPVRHLYIKHLPRSGKPEQLREKYKIDANAIIEEVMKK